MKDDSAFKWVDLQVENRKLKRELRECRICLVLLTVALVVLSVFGLNLAKKVQHENAQHTRMEAK